MRLGWQDSCSLHIGIILVQSKYIIVIIYASESRGLSVVRGLSDPLYRHQSMRPAQACAWATLLHCVGGTLALGLAIRQNPEEDQASKVKYVKPSETCDIAYWIRINLSHILAFHSSNLKHFRIPLFASMCLISMLGDLVHNKNARISSLCATVLAHICKHMCRCAFHHNTITYPHPHTRLGELRTAQLQARNVDLGAWRCHIFQKAWCRCNGNRWSPDP